MCQIIPSKRLDRALRRMVKRGKDIAKLQAVVEKLRVGEALEPRYGPHPLAGDWKPYWDCYIEPDWLLIYQVTDEAGGLVRTGSHADLF